MKDHQDVCFCQPDRYGSQELVLLSIKDCGKEIHPITNPKPDRYLLKIYLL